MSSNKKYYKKKKPQIEDNYIPPYDALILQDGVDTLSLTEPLLNKLKNGKVETLHDIVKRRAKDLYKISTFNKKDLFEITRALANKKMAIRPDDIEENIDGVNNKNNNLNRPVQSGKNQPNNKNNQGLVNSGKQINNNNSKKGGIKITTTTSVNITEKQLKDEREKKRPKKAIIQMPKDIYVKISKNGKWGFADRSGKEVIKPIYDEAFVYKEDLCCVEKNELFGFIDRNGEEIIPIVYECAASFSEGYACVFKNGKCGYINKNNENIVDFKFDAGTQVTEGNCRVKRDGKWGELFIDKPTDIRWIN